MSAVCGDFVGHDHDHDHQLARTGRQEEAAAEVSGGELNNTALKANASINTSSCEPQLETLNNVSCFVSIHLSQCAHIVLSV